MSRRPAEPPTPSHGPGRRGPVAATAVVAAALVAFGGACATSPQRGAGDDPPAIASVEESGVAVRVAILADPQVVPDGVEARVGLAGDASAWPSGPFVRRAVGTFRGGRAEVLVEDVPRGRWAVVAYADLDGDGKLARTVLGVPREPIGYGNDAVPRFGPPAFEACVVEVGDRPVETALTLRVD